MTDDPASPDAPLPGPATPEAVHPVHAEPAGEQRNRVPLVVAVVAVVIAIAAGLWARSSVHAADDQVIAIQGRLDGMEMRLQQAEQRPGPPDLRPLQQQVAALEARPAPNLGPLTDRLAALETKPPPESALDAAGHTEIAALAGRVDQITARQTQLGESSQTELARIGDQVKGQDARLAEQAKALDAKLADQARAQDGRFAALDGKLDALAKTGSTLDALSQREARTAQLGAAAVALAAGRPLGVIAGAPPALAKFATAAPPTEAALRLAFSSAADAAQRAGLPTPADKPFLDRVWARAQSTVTVRQGDRVVLGDAVTGVLDTSRRLLNAGDLPGSVAALDGLAGDAAAAMAEWRAQAQSVLDARAALLTAARG